MGEAPRVTTTEAQRQVRRAGPEDAPAIGRLLDAFNAEFGDPTPGPEAIAGRVRELLQGPDDAALLAGTGPDGLAFLRFRPALFSAGLECYLAELYVVPHLRGGGIGRALLEASLGLARERGADYIDLDTSEADEAARALYESCGFTNREGGPDGPVMYGYEREL